MSQHDMDVADGFGGTVRADINAALQALASNSSGASEPTTTFAFQFWFDTTNSLLKMRNAANSAWVTVASLSGSTWTPYIAGFSILAAANVFANTNTFGTVAPQQKWIGRSADDLVQVRLYKSDGSTTAGVIQSTGTALELYGPGDALGLKLGPSSGKGVLVGSGTTGGFQGDGTVNATGFYVDGTELGVAALTESFESAEQAITAAGALTLAHGLTAKPLLVQGVLVCQTGELGYTAGDELIVNSGISASAAVNGGISVVPDATNVNVRFGNYANVFQVLRKDTGVASGLTLADWKFKVRAWR